MTVYNDLMGKLDNAGLLFNVREEGVLTASGQVVPKRKALINTKSGEVMSVVSEAYRTVPNEEIFAGFCKAVEDSGINADGAQVNVRQTPTGSRAMVDFVFPNQTVSFQGDVTALQIAALNSFDGTTRYLTKAGGLRMKCLNGQILGRIVGSYSSKHQSTLDVDAGAAQVIKMVQEFNNAKEYWQTLMMRSVSYDTRLRVYADFLGLKALDSNDLLDNSRFQHVMKLDHSYTQEMGGTAWALYNVLTDYTTHFQPRGKAQSVGSAARMRARLEKTLDSTEVLGA